MVKNTDAILKNYSCNTGGCSYTGWLTRIMSFSFFALQRIKVYGFAVNLN